MAATMPWLVLQLCRLELARQQGFQTQHVAETWRLPWQKPLPSCCSRVASELRLLLETKLKDALEEAAENN